MKIKTNQQFKEFSASRIIFTGLLVEVDRKAKKKFQVFSASQEYYNEIYTYYKKKHFTSEKDTSFSLYDQIKSDEIHFFSINEKDNLEKLRHFGGKIINQYKKNQLEIEIDFSGLKQMSNFLTIPEDKLAYALIEGLWYGSYEFDKYLSKKKFNLKEVVLVASPLPLSSIIKEISIINEAASLAKDLVNEPPNFLNAVTFAQRIKRKTKEHRIKFNVLNNRSLKKKKLEAILAVNAGSKNEARLVTLEYSPAKPKKTILLVGKGVTFDSGGLSLKPSKHMEGMKMDMSGAAVVFATIVAACQLKIPLKIISVLPLTDNMTGGEAFRVGDVIPTYSGKNVEVLNTDAEGRLILADAISYSEEKYSPDYIIDLATLTGACLAALGVHYAGLFTHNKNLSDSLIKSGEETGEKLWPLPLDEVYNDDLKSSIADLKNIGGPYGGAITAAKFIENFVNKKNHWAHLDIASTMEFNKSQGYFKKGGSGFGVRLLIHFLRTLSNK